jgi:hypothetical protein
LSGEPVAAKQALGVGARGDQSAQHLVHVRVTIDADQRLRRFGRERAQLGRRAEQPPESVPGTSRRAAAYWATSAREGRAGGANRCQFLARSAFHSFRMPTRGARSTPPVTAPGLQPSQGVSPCGLRAALRERYASFALRNA